MAGNRSSPSWVSYTRGLTITPPCQLLNSYIFFILPNRFLPLWNQRKRAYMRPSWKSVLPLHASSNTTPPLHHRDFSILPNPFLSLLSQLTLWLFKGWGPRLGIDPRSIGFEHHSLDHYTTMAKAERLTCFFTLLNPIFSLWNRLKKISWPSGNRAWLTNLEHHTPN